MHAFSYFTAPQRPLFLEMAQEMYHSGAVLRPVPEAYHQRTFDAILEPGAPVFGILLKQGEQPAGYAVASRYFSVEAGGQTLWIEDLYVRPAFRSQGFGRAFFSFLKREFEPSVSRFRLEVEPGNHRAIALYTSLGFSVLPYVQMVQDA
ncbi:MAG: GNAT family N-acetyltransferase [Oscillospiraceae bacterium]